DSRALKPSCWPGHVCRLIPRCSHSKACEGFPCIPTETDCNGWSYHPVGCSFPRSLCLIVLCRDCRFQDYSRTPFGGSIPCPIPQRTACARRSTPILR